MSMWCGEVSRRDVLQEIFFFAFIRLAYVGVMPHNLIVVEFDRLRLKPRGG